MVLTVVILVLVGIFLVAIFVSVNGHTMVHDRSFDHPPNSIRGKEGVPHHVKHEALEEYRDHRYGWGKYAPPMGLSAQEQKERKDRLLRAFLSKKNVPDGPGTEREARSYSEWEKWRKNAEEHRTKLWRQQRDALWRAPRDVISSEDRKYLNQELDLVFGSWEHAYRDDDFGKESADELRRKRELMWLERLREKGLRLDGERKLRQMG